MTETSRRAAFSRSAPGARIQLRQASTNSSSLWSHALSSAQILARLEGQLDWAQYVPKSYPLRTRNCRTTVEELPQSCRKVAPRAKLRQEFDRNRPMSAELWLNVAEVGRTLARVNQTWPILAKVGQTHREQMPKFVPSLAEFGPNIGRVRPKLGQTLTTSAMLVYRLDQVAPMLVEVGNVLARLGKPEPFFCQHRPISVDSGPNLGPRATLRQLLRDRRENVRDATFE